MEKSSKRAVEAIIKKEKIGIFGDYDVDGPPRQFTGNAELNIDFRIYIQTGKSGYGPSIKSFKN